MDKVRKQLELDLEKQKLQLDLDKRQHETHLNVEEKKKLAEVESNQPPKFDLTKCLKLVPEFNEKDVDSFFRNFEDIASSLNWPLDQWVWLVKSRFQGKAAVVVSHMVGEKEYEVIKQAILDAYMITTEGYRQKFRNYLKNQTQTWYEFANEKLRLFNKWIKAADVDNFEKLINLIVTEEFMRKLPHNIKLHIADKEESDLKKAALLADSYSLIHRSFRGPEKGVKENKASFDSGEGENANYCSYCKRTDHNISECKYVTCKKSKYFNESSKDKAKGSKSPPKGKRAMHCTNTVNNNLFEQYISEGSVTLANGVSIKVRVLRDTGSNQSMILNSTVPNIEKLDENVLIQDLSHSNLLPLVNLHLNCDYVNGPVKIALREKPFPVQNVQVLLGNDLAGKLSLPNLILCNNPISTEHQECEPGEHGETSVQVVTRSQVSDTVIENPSSPVDLKVACSRDELIKLQKEDCTLNTAYKNVSNKGDKLPGFYIHDEVLFRLYRPKKLTPNDTWADREQVVVPLPLRSEILSIAHHSDSHLGVTKTYNRLINDFFWPNMKKDVSKFVKECHVCQVTGKPAEKIPKAPLVPVVVPHEPFNKIIIDCVGPLPKTRKGNQYILTIMCPTTRYPIAIPLKNICAKNIVKHLLTIFSTYGFPREIQTDRGTNFTSNIFAETLTEFNVKHSLASPYHPQSQGALERHHQTLKSLIKKFCLETGSDWDEQLDLLLFVIREVPNDSLGISPFEMLYGHRVRGPLQIFKDKLLDNVNCNEVNLTQFVNNLREKFNSIHSFAHKNLKDSQKVMKENFDKSEKSKVRKFKEGDLVLAYFPISTSPFQHKFSGPYTIIKCANNNNYVLQTPDRRKTTQLVHVNLIKKYHGTPPVALFCSKDSRVTNEVNLKNISDSDTTEKISFADVTNSEIIKNLPVYFQHLSPSQSTDLTKLLLSYPETCGDHPQECTISSHNVELLPETRPIRQAFYRVNREKLKLMKEEVSYLMKQGLVQRSSSPWSSPCLLVPKPNNKVRLVTDYRKVNLVTVKDSFPLPRIEDILDSIANSRFLTNIDLLRGYYQIPLTDRAKLISAFITPFGLFQYERLPFGMCNAPATFQRIMNSVIQDLEGTYVYIDDLVVVADTWPEHLHRLQAVFDRLQAAGLTINLAKSSFGCGKITYLGHTLGGGEIMPKSVKISAIAQYPVPSNRKDLMRFLGMTSYYRKFCKNYSIVANPLLELTSPKTKFIWTDSCDRAFQQLKDLLCSKPVLAAPDAERPFFIQVDACETGIGAVLLQENLKTGIKHPTSYFSCKLKPHQRNYSTIEKELLAIILTIQKFEVYFSTNIPIIIYTDHNPLVFLKRSQHTNQRLLRWSLFLEEYNLHINHIRGTENLMADALSRIPGLSLQRGGM